MVASTAIISCLTVGQACGGEAKGFVGYPTGSFGEGSQSPSFGAVVSLPVAGAFGIRAGGTIQHYKHVGSEGLDAKFTFIGVGIEGTFPVPGVELLSAQVAVSPAIVPSRWRGVGLNQSETVIGMSVGVSMLVHLSQRYLVTLGLTKYVSDSGTTLVFFDRPPLELPGLSETVAEAGVGVRW
jgi:hypothetical protein